MSKIIKVRYGGHKFAIYDTDKLGRNLVDGKGWEPHITEFMRCVIKPTDTFVDVGANFGYHTVFGAAMVPEGIVHAFEPHPLIHNLLTRTVKLNNLTNVMCHKSALGNANENVFVSKIDTTKLSNMGTVSIRGSGEKTVCRTLDVHTLDPAFIKIDVQGYEKQVLLGGKETIERCRPFMVVEFEDVWLTKFGYDSGDLFKLIRDMDYYVMFLDYKYPSDHICVPIEMMEGFRERFYDQIKPHENNNKINNNVKHGVNEKFCRGGN